MKRLFVALMVSAFPEISAAQQTQGRIAYDYCYSYPIEDGYAYACNVYAFDPGGSTVNLGFGFDPAVSPDGTRVAFVVLSEPLGYSLEFADIAVVDLRDGTSISLTPGDRAAAPAWSRDGGRIAFQCTGQSGRRNLCSINADGTGFTRLTDSDSDDA